jgi:serpin B
MIKIVFLFIIFNIIICNNLNFQNQIFYNLQQLTYNNLLSLTEYKYTKKNICISPLSIYQIISLVSNGANGITQKEILQVLTKKDDQKTQINLNLNNENILKIYDNNLNISIANAIMSIIPISEKFGLICKRYNAFYSVLRNVEQVNKWCEENTNGKIKKIIDNINGIDLILLNAVYFKYDWKFPFKKKETSKKNFYNENKSISKVDMMLNHFNNIMYYEDDKIQMIELPYKDDNLSMIIILPKKEKYISLYDYYNKEKIDFSKLINKLQIRQNVILNLPKFEIEYETSLKDSLMYMNMKQAFNYNADFSKISEVNKLYIDDIIHKTYIKVDELGTEAAAVTAVIMVRSAGRLFDDVLYMNVNHGFYYMIRDKRIKDIFRHELMLFIGKIDNL